MDSAPLNYVKKFDPKALLNITPDRLFFVIPTSLQPLPSQFSFFKAIAVWTDCLQIIKAAHLNSSFLCSFLSMGFMMCPIVAGSNSTCSIDHNNIIHALSTYYIRMMPIYYEYVTIITYATRCYYDDYDLITNSLRYLCRIITLPIPLRRYFTCNSTRDSFHERWRMPRTYPNLVGMQDDIRKNVPDSTKNLCELKTMGYIVSS